MIDAIIHDLPEQEFQQGMVIGIVLKEVDPAGLGRIKVSFPLSNGNITSNWARVASFSAGKDRGAFFLPQEGDEVLVGFLFGKLSMPYILGAVWNGEAWPPVFGDEEQQNINCIKTKSGITISLVDTKDNEQIIIEDVKSNKIMIETKTDTITISANKNITLRCDECLTINANKLVMNITEDATLNAETINIVGDEETSITADMVKIN